MSRSAPALSAGPQHAPEGSCSVHAAQRLVGMQVHVDFAALGCFGQMTGAVLAVTTWKWASVSRRCTASRTTVSLEGTSFLWDTVMAMPSSTACSACTGDRAHAVMYMLSCMHRQTGYMPQTATGQEENLVVHWGSKRLPQPTRALAQLPAWSAPRGRHSMGTPAPALSCMLCMPPCHASSLPQQEMGDSVWGLCSRPACLACRQGG